MYTCNCLFKKKNKQIETNRMKKKKEEINEGGKIRGGNMEDDFSRRRKFLAWRKSVSGGIGG